MKKGEFEKALSCFAKALDLDLQNVDYLRLVSELAEITGDNDRLHKSLKKLWNWIRIMKKRKKS